MSTKYKATDPEGKYFVTLTVVGWIDVFTRPGQKDILVENLKHCQREKGLEIYAYCVMSNHMHMICKAVGNNSLADVMRDFKKFTSKKIIEHLHDEPESRREWMIKFFQDACYKLKRDQKFKVWQDGYHAEVLFSNKFLAQELNYIHQNPVKERIVEKPEDYVYSSARSYAGMVGELDVVLIDLF